MTDDRDSHDAADWLSAQFGSDDDPTDPTKSDGTESDRIDADRIDADRTESEGEKPDAAEPDAPKPDFSAQTFSKPDFSKPVDPTVSAAPLTPATPATPVAPETPAAPASGGFSWGLKPRDATTPSPDPVTPEPIAPDPVTPEPAAPQLPAAPEPTPFTPPFPFATPPAPVVPPAAPVTPPATPPLPPMPLTPPSGTPVAPSHTDSPFAPRLQPPWRADESGAGVVPSSEGEPGQSGAPEFPSVTTTPVTPTVEHHWPFAPRAADAESIGSESTEPPIEPQPPVAPQPQAPVAPQPPEPPFPLVPPVTPDEPAGRHEPEPFDSSLAGAPSPEAEPRTMALPWESAGTELFTPAAAGSPVAEPATELLSGFETTPADAAAGSSIDSLFGATQFRDYEAEPASSQNPFPRSPGLGSPEPPPPGTRKSSKRQPLPRSQKVLLWIAGVLIALLVLVGLFFLGTKLSQSAAAPVPTPTATKSATPSPTPTVLAVGPLAPGTYKWDRLLGGECLAPFTTPWVEKFTVVDCATPHPAQMVARGVFADAPKAAVTDPSAVATPAAGNAKSESTYPGIEALQAQINLLCSSPTVIDFAAAGAYSDIQFIASYPANDKQWSDGDHNYYCFVTRSSGDPLTASVAVAPAA